MFSKDVQIVLGPNIANELKQLLRWWRGFPGKAGPALPGQSGTRTHGSIPAPKVGKAYENIAPRTFGNVKIWAGVPGQETEMTFLPDPVQEFNLLDRKITSGYWCWMFGQYIFGAHFPAREIEATLSGPLSASSGGVSATVGTYTGGDNPGATVTIYPPATGIIGTQTVASGSTVWATWNDVNQQYVARGWGCG